MTNADAIRAMTDEELAEYFATFETICYYRLAPDAVCDTKVFVQEHLEWLKQEIHA